MNEHVLHDARARVPAHRDLRPAPPTRRDATAIQRAVKEPSIPTQAGEVGLPEWDEWKSVRDVY